jgi:hypothetical protein
MFLSGCANCGGKMPTKGPEDYLEIAQAAEKAADVADSVQARQSWQAIAKEYRALAAEKLKRLQGQTPHS